MTKFINLNKERKNKLSFDKPGSYIVFFHNLSGKYIFELKESGIEVEIYGLYTGKSEDTFKLETIQSHQAPESISNLLIKGVFEDKASFNYEGLIRIEKNAYKSSAYQKNQNLNLSNDVFVESKPYLEILNNDVVCSHGSTTGGLNKEEIFYLKSRGLNEKQAEEILVKGFINEIYEKIKNYVKFTGN